MLSFSEERAQTNDASIVMSGLLQSKSFGSPPSTDGIGQMLISAAVAFPPAGPAAGSPSLSLAPPAPGPVGPKHPDGERLFPYQSGNTAPPPHPLYKKHDSSVPR